MLIYLFDFLSQFFKPLHAFLYLSSRAMLGLLTAMVISLVTMPKLIERLQCFKFGQVVRSDGPSDHFKKKGTPTMGGINILFSTAIATLLWAKLDNPYVWILLFVMLGFGIVGFFDDYLKIKHKSSDGLIARRKYFYLSVVSIIAVVIMYYFATLNNTTYLIIPFFKQYMPNLGILFVILGYFVLVGTSNAVNLTDGLDGLAIVPVMMVAGAFAIVAYLTGNYHFANYLYLPFIKEASEVAVFSAILIGSGLGFLYFNAYPAKVFMGDVGSLALGGTLGAMAVLLRQELLLAIMGIVFVLETLSVILQVGSYKLRKKRIFKMAPLHHHFELKNTPEPQVTVRFWIISVVAVMIALLSLKMR